MDDTTFLDRLIRVLPPGEMLDETLRRAAEHKFGLDRERLRRRTIRYVGPLHHNYAINDTPFHSHAIGAAAIAHAVRNPGQAVGLSRRPDGTRLTAELVRKSITAVLKTIDNDVDAGLAAALRVARERGPGIRVSTGPAGQVLVRYTPGDTAVGA